MKILSEKIYNEVAENGYTTISNAIGKDLTTSLRSRLADLVQAQRKNQTEQTASDDYMVHNPMFLDSAFMNLLEHPSIVEVFDTFLSSTSIIYACTTSSMPAGSSNYSNRIHVDSPRIIPGYISKIGIILALDDFTVDNGATYLLPGSPFCKIGKTENITVTSTNFGTSFKVKLNEVTKKPQIIPVPQIISAAKLLNDELLLPRKTETMTISATNTIP